MIALKELEYFAYETRQKNQRSLWNCTSNKTTLEYLAVFDEHNLVLNTNCLVKLKTSNSKSIFGQYWLPICQNSSSSQIPAKIICLCGLYETGRNLSEIPQHVILDNRRCKLVLMPDAESACEPNAKESSFLLLASHR